MGEWEEFTFYYGQHIGWRLQVGDRVFEVIPTNGRAGRWDVLEDGEWVGETFSSPEAAREWVS